MLNEYSGTITPMIGYLSGTILTVREKAVVLQVRGVGYLVNVRKQLLSSLTSGDDYSFFTELIVKDNALELYGFKEDYERKLFVFANLG